VKLPPLNVSAIPANRKVSSTTELKQFVATDQKALSGSIAAWVQALARQKDEEALRAGNPKIRLITVNGTTGKSGNQRTGFRPGTIAQATRSVRVQYLGDELAQLAMKLVPLLSRVIAETFPDSKTKLLAGNWEWYVQRNVKKNGKASKSEALGKTVPHDIGIYDVLWYVPAAPLPAKYAWFANYFAKQRFGYKYNLTKKTLKSVDATGTVVKHRVTRLKKRMRGFAGEASRRMKGAKSPGVVVKAMMIQKQMTASSSKAKWGIPVIRIAFRRQLSTGVEH
jgi:hypothetical protein